MTAPAAVVNPLASISGTAPGPESSVAALTCSPNQYPALKIELSMRSSRRWIVFAGSVVNDE
jgi:hypothetical protein